MLINLSTIDFSSVSSGSSLNIQEEKTVNMLLTDNSIDILPDTGFDGMAKVIVSHAPVKETVEQTITANGSHVITPDTGYDAMIKCVVDVNVSGEIDFSSIGYNDSNSNDCIGIINDNISYSQSLLADYNDNKNYYNDKKFVYVPLFPTQNRTNFSAMFNKTRISYCPDLDTSNGTLFGIYKPSGYADMGMFSYCSSLVSSPFLDTSKGTDFSAMFYGCSLLSFLPSLDTSKGTSFQNMLYGCSVLPQIILDTSSGIYFNNMCYGCNKLTSVSLTDTSKGTDFSQMFRECYKLTSISGLDTSSGTNFWAMFTDCEALESLPTLNTSSGTKFEMMFSSCEKLTSVSLTDTSKGTDFTMMFYGCQKMETITGMDFSSLTNKDYLRNWLGYDIPLKNITFTGAINVSVSFTAAYDLTYDSIKSILTACSKTTDTNEKTVSFKRTIQDQNNELTNLVASCTEKGWSVTGLTITQ